MLLPEERKSANIARLKQVEIRFNPTSKLLTITPDRVEVFIDPQDSKKSQEVKWNCQGARVEIDFKKTDTPFLAYHVTCANGGYCASGVPLNSSIRAGEYSYQVTVTSPGSPRTKVVTQSAKIKVSSVAPLVTPENEIIQSVPGKVKTDTPVTKRKKTTAASQKEAAAKTAKKAPAKK